MPIKFTNKTFSQDIITTNKTFSQEIITLLLKGGSKSCADNIGSNCKASGVRITFYALIDTIVYDNTKLFGN